MYILFQLAIRVFELREDRIMGRRFQSYKGKSIEISYDTVRCIHAGECVRGLSNVFNPKRNPWIDPDQASADEIAGVIGCCPTGALKFIRQDGGVAQKPDAANCVTITENGPLYVRGRIRINRADGSVLLNDSRVAFCRCGATRHLPYCDGSHDKSRFQDPGTATISNVDEHAGLKEGEVLKVTPLENGPLLFEGPVEIRNADSRLVFRGLQTALCRCGSSATKPFCDGTHARIGFKGSSE